MAYPKKSVNSFDAAFVTEDLNKEELDSLKGKGLDEVLSILANSDSQKIAIASAIIHQLKTTGDPSAFKALLSSLERQGMSGEKELPISDERFIEIIKTVASRV